jgi:membrane protease YdiL (CAAX protease family)
MLRTDGLTNAFTITAVLVAVYFATFDLSIVILFPVILLITGIVLQMYVRGKVEEDEHIDRKEAESIVIWAMLCLAVIAVASFSVSVLPSMFSKLAFTPTNTVMYGVLMAVAEEHFFRGAVTGFLLKITFPSVAVIGSGAIFAVYHLAVYGTNTSSMIYVMVAGIVLSWAAYRTKRLSPGILAHVANNIMSTVI